MKWTYFLVLLFPVPKLEAEHHSVAKSEVGETLLRNSELRFSMGLESPLCPSGSVELEMGETLNKELRTSDCSWGWTVGSIVFRYSTMTDLTSLMIVIVFTYLAFLVFCS